MFVRATALGRFLAVSAGWPMDDPHGRANERRVSAGLLLAALPAVFGILSQPAAAQTSASFQMEGHVLNMSGRPSDGATAGSAGFRISLDSLGGTPQATGLSSPSYSMDGGWLPAYAPPGEVINLAFLDRDTLDWDAEGSARVYHLYRDALSTLSNAYAGACEQQDVPASTTTDPGAPAVGDAWFYLVTAENRLGEEGTRGANGPGLERPDTGACP